METSPNRSSSASAPCSSAARARIPGSRGSRAKLGRWRCFVLPGLVAALALCTGCDDDSAAEVDRCIEQSIAQGRQANWTQGVWRISGDGERTSCTDESLNADSMSISSRPIRVHQQGHFLFLEDAPHYPGFALSGMVGDRCIHVRTAEQTAYGVVHYDLPAFFMTSSSFGGDFTGSGPETCRAEGTFDVFANLDAIPASPIANPAPPDAGTDQASLCQACIDSCQLVDVEYIAACESGCDQFVCHPATPPDAGAEDTGIPDAAEDVVDASEDSQADADAAADAADDADDANAADASDADADDASSADAGDAGAGDSSDDANADDADADDAAEDGSEAGVDAAEADADSVDYVLWDGSAGWDEDASDDSGTGCSVRGSGVPWSGSGAAAIVAAMVLGLSLRRRH